MKVLITGASSKLGEFVIRELMDRHELVLMSRREPLAEFSALPWVQGDLNDLEACRQAVRGMDAIQHLAAQPWPVDHPELQSRAVEQGLPLDATFKSNMLGTYYLLQAAVEAGVGRIIMSGSNCALGHGYRISSTPFPLQSLPIDESHPCYPEDSYSYSKLAGEMLLATYTRAYGLRTYMTRPSGICPPQRRQQMAQNAAPAQGWNPWLWCWVGSEDVASAHRLIMEAAEGLPPHDVYFLNADDTTALEPSLELVKRFNPELEPLAEGLTGHESFFSNQKLKEAVGWRPQTSWRNQ